MNLTHDKRKANLAKWKAQGPGLIQRPLRKIQARTAIKTVKDGVVQFEESEVGREARHAANRGDGAYVSMLMRQVMSGELP